MCHSLTKNNGTARRTFPAKNKRTFYKHRNPALQTGSAGFLLLPPFSSRSDAPLVKAHLIFLYPKRRK